LLMGEMAHVPASRSLATAPGLAIRTTVPEWSPFLRLIDRVRFAGRSSRRTVSSHLPLSFSLDKNWTREMLSIHSSDLETGSGEKEGLSGATKTARGPLQRPLRAEILKPSW
jgi:hypothetical protein